VGKGKRVDVYLEVRKRRGHIFFERNKYTVVIYIEECIELALHAFYSSKRHYWYLKFTLISQGYFPLLFPIIFYMSSSLIFK
jgi:hypothetical protein